MAIRALADPDSKPTDFARPGHIFPLEAKEGGVLRRAGHTETAVDLCRLAGLFPAGLLTEILDDTGDRAKRDALIKMARDFNLKIINIHYSPAFWANSLVVWLYKVGATLSITTVIETHHLRPLVKAAVTVALGGVVVVAVAFDFRVVGHVFACLQGDIGDIQVLCHNVYGILDTIFIFAHDCQVIIDTAIARVNKCLVALFLKLFQRQGLIERFIGPRTGTFRRHVEHISSIHAQIYFSRISI